MTLADKLDQPLPEATQQALKRIAEPFVQLAKAVSNYARKVGNYLGKKVRKLNLLRRVSLTFAIKKPSPKTIQPTHTEKPILKLLAFIRTQFQLAPPFQLGGLETAMRGTPTR